MGRALGLGVMAIGLTVAASCARTTATSRRAKPGRLATAAESRSEESQPAARYHEQSIRIPSRGIVLEGTLALPGSAGPHPGIVLIHGSGPIDRDAIFPGQLGHKFGVDVATFHDLAAGLASSGFAVLRYDKRSCNRESGCENDYPIAEIRWDDLRADAKAAIDFLSRRAEVEATRIVVIGHSQGAAFVPSLMEGDPRIVAGVLLAGPHRHLADLWDYQADFLVQRQLEANTHPLVANANVDWLHQTARSLRRLRAGRYYDKSINGRPIAFWRGWSAAVDAAPAQARRLERPLLVLSGGADSNVPPSETRLWAQTLADANAHHRVKILPCVTHALNCLKPSGHSRTPSKHVSTEVIAEIVDFLAARSVAETASMPVVP